jgi:hypothetical protein
MKWTLRLHALRHSFATHLPRGRRRCPQPLQSLRQGKSRLWVAKLFGSLIRLCFALILCLSRPCRDLGEPRVLARYADGRRDTSAWLSLVIARNFLDKADDAPP